MGITNSKTVKELFGDYVVYSEDTSCLYDFAANEDKLISHKKMKESMEYVKNNHTYLNSIQKTKIIQMLNAKKDLSGFFCIYLF